MALWAQSYLWVLDPHGFYFQQTGQKHGRKWPVEGHFWALALLILAVSGSSARLLPYCSLLYIYWCTGLSHCPIHSWYTAIVAIAPSLEELQHLWTADPSLYYNWRYGKSTHLARNQPETMRMTELIWPPPAKLFFNKCYLAICVPVHQSACPICAAAGDYFVLSSTFFIEIVWNAHMHTNYIAPPLSVVHSLDWPFCCVLSAALSFNLM